MAPSVIHQPRVAWDAARAFVRAAAGADFDAFAGEVHNLLGRAYGDELMYTRLRLCTAEVGERAGYQITDAEVGMWRARLEDLLRERPELVGTVRNLTGRVPRR
jgi:hypothetical protein